MSDLSVNLVRLLAILADAKWHSGEELGAELGISRAAISKQLKQLDVLQLAFESVAGKGYRLLQPLDLLDQQAVLLALSAECQILLSELQIHHVIDSTNALLMAEQLERSVHGKLCVAQQQLAGQDIF